jgi:transcriptional regulator with XRE-family HTH domain
MSKTTYVTKPCYQDFAGCVIEVIHDEGSINYSNFIEGGELVNYINGNIKRLRNAKGWTQKQLGDKIGKLYDAILRMEKDCTSISIEDVIKLSKIFEVSLDDLVDSNIDVEKVMETKKIELSHYNIKSLHPTIDKDFNNLSPTLKEFGKAMALEIYREVAGVTKEQLKQEVSNDCIDDIESILRGTYSHDEEITIDEVIELIGPLRLETV